MPPLPASGVAADGRYRREPGGSAVRPAAAAAAGSGLLSGVVDRSGRFRFDAFRCVARLGSARRGPAPEAFAGGRLRKGAFSEKMSSSEESSSAVPGISAGWLAAALCAHTIAVRVQ